MGGRTSKRDSNGKLTKCPDCGKAVRRAKGLKARSAVCVGKSSQGKAA